MRGARMQGDFMMCKIHLNLRVYNLSLGEVTAAWDPGHGVMSDKFIGKILFQEVE